MTAFRPNNDHARVRYVLLRRYSPPGPGEVKEIRTAKDELPASRIERRRRRKEAGERKGKKRTNQEKKSWTNVENEKEGTTENIYIYFIYIYIYIKGTRTKRVEIEHLRQYTGYARARPSSLCLPVDEKFLTKKKKEDWYGGRLCRTETKNDPSTPKPRSLFPSSPISSWSQGRRCVLLYKET